jgi:hypothetical protein
LRSDEDDSKQRAQAIDDLADIMYTPVKAKATRVRKQ